MKKILNILFLACILASGVSVLAETVPDSKDIGSETTAEEETNDSISENKDEKKETETVRKNIPEENYETYLNTLNEQQRKYLKENWSRHKKAREANGVLFIEYESAKSKSLGHIFFFPDWNTTHQMIRLAETGSDKGYDCFIFLPIPEVAEHLPNSEDNAEIADIKDAFLNYVKASIDTIGAHDKINIVLSAGDTISWILSGIEEGIILKPDGIIAYNAAYRDPDANAFVATQLSTFRGIFADIVTKESNSYLNDAVEKRTFMLKKQGRKPSTFKLIRCGDLCELDKSFGAYLKKTKFKTGGTVRKSR